MRIFKLLAGALVVAAGVRGEEGDNLYAIQYFCFLGGGLEPNAEQAAAGCHHSEAVIEEWLAEVRIGSGQNGTKFLDRNQWDFSVRTFSDLIGDGSGLEVWDWTFSSAGTLDWYEFGDFQVLDLATNGTGPSQISKIDAGGTPGFRAIGDQTGYLGSSGSDEENGVRIVQPDTSCLSGVGSPAWVYWNNTTQWNWTLSFTNDTANFSLFTSQAIGNLSLEATCTRMMNATPLGDPGDYPSFMPEPVELLNNGTGPMFYNWNTSKTYPMTSAAAPWSTTPSGSKALVFMALIGLYVFLL